MKNVITKIVLIAVLALFAACDPSSGGSTTTPPPGDGGWPPSPPGGGTGGGGWPPSGGGSDGGGGAGPQPPGPGGSTTHTVTFNTSGGDTPNTNVPVPTGGQVAQPPDPSRAGFVFVDWFTSPLFTTPFDFTTPITSARTVFAGWQPNPIPGVVPHSDFNFAWNTSPLGWRVITYVGSSLNPIIPPTLPDGIPVVAVGDNVFNSINTGLVLDSVTIPSSVTTIGSFAFDGNSLTSVSIPNVTTIGNNAFRNNSLTIVSIPNATTIGNSAFEGNSLSGILTIPNSVTLIGEQAFFGNTLSEVIIPNSVTTIGNGAFRSNNLANITIGSSVTTIPEAAFMDNSLSGILTIPNTVTAIGWSAFENNGIFELNIPSVTTIGNRAFANNGLEIITIGDNVGIGNNESMGNFGLEFNTFYMGINASQGGTFTWDGISAWN